MKIIDISWPITPNTTTYKDKKNLTITKTLSFTKDHVREHTLSLSTHTGTHIDAPAHFLNDGATIEKINLTKLIGSCLVLDMTHIEEKITANDLQKYDLRNTRILFKTKNSDHAHDEPFDYKFIYLDHSGAQFLADNDALCVGIDYLGIEREQKNHESHKVLMAKNIPIIEGLRLAHVDAGTYDLICLPLSLPGLEACPARAVLIQK